MDSRTTCGRCGAEMNEETAGGLCPRCLMALNFDSRTMPEGEEAPALPPLSPEEMAARFPQFEILECLGRGGMGVVYMARQKTLDRLVAIKLLAGEWQGDAAFAERFEKEAKILARMSHPSIVTVHDFGETGGLFYIVMEFVDGVNLRDLLREGKMAPEQALAIVPPICEALEYAHAKDVVHRDIKPENILLDRDGRVKIADFGIASLVGASGEQSGTPPYMPPEQAGGHSDQRADIYALGVVLYEMLTGERPTGNLVAPSRKVEVDVKIDELVLRALEKEPELRFQTAEEFRTLVTNLNPAPDTDDAPGLPDRHPNAIFLTRFAIVLGTVGVLGLLACLGPWEWLDRFQGFFAIFLVFGICGFLGAKTTSPRKVTPIRASDDGPQLDRKSTGAVARFWWLFVVMPLVLGIVGASLGGLASNVVPNSYRATSTVLFTPVQLHSPEHGQLESRQIFQTQFEVIIASKTLQPVIREARLADRWSLSESECLQRLKGSIDTRQRPGTDLIEIQVQDSDPALTARIANAVADSYATVLNREIKEAVKVIDDAKVPTLPANRKVANFAFLGFLAGVVLSPLLTLLLMPYLNRRFPSKRMAKPLTPTSPVAKWSLGLLIAALLGTPLLIFLNPHGDIVILLIFAALCMLGSLVCSLMSLDTRMGRTVGLVWLGSGFIAAIFTIALFGIWQFRERSSEQEARKVEEAARSSMQVALARNFLDTVVALAEARSSGLGEDHPMIKELLARLATMTEPANRPAKPILTPLIQARRVEFQQEIDGLRAKGFADRHPDIKSVEAALEALHAVEQGVWTPDLGKLSGEPETAITTGALTGRWQLDLPVPAEVVFKKDGSWESVATILGRPSRSGGSWSLDGRALVLTKAESGEEETFTIENLTDEGMVLSRVDDEGERIEQNYRRLDEPSKKERTAQVAVEDLAIRLLAAIRDDDEETLKSLAIDRIAGWREALPVFAAELRERFRALTGETFTLAPTKTLVADDLAVVRCTGSDKLAGKCLILHFANTEDGWRNVMLRNSTDDVALEKHLEDLRGQVEDD